MTFVWKDESLQNSQRFDLRSQGQQSAEAVVTRIRRSGMQARHVNFAGEMNRTQPLPNLVVTY